MTADIVLPRRKAEGGVPIETALAERRSLREFQARALTLEQIGQLLWAAQGVTRKGRRTAPSAGALYPLEVDVASGEVEGLSSGVYRYVPERHALRRAGTSDVRWQLAEAALHQRWVARAPVILIVVAIPERTAAQYGDRAGRYVWFEAGCVAENVALQAVGLGLGTTVIGAFDDDRICDLIDRPDAQPLCLLPVGFP